MTDLRYALRFFWTHKAFAAAAILTLALGLGANTALYGMFNATLRPLPLPDSKQLVVIAAEARGDETGGFQFNFSIEQLKDLQQRADVFSDVVGHMPRVGGVLINGKASQFWYTAVSGNYFSGLRVRPAAGSLFTRESGSPVHVVLGHAFWIKHFGGDPHVVGMPIRMDGAAAIISGVVERSFRGTVMGVEMDGYIAAEDYGTINPDANRWLYHNRKARGMNVLARLRPGVSLEDAQASLDVLMKTLEAEYPESDRGIAAAVIPEPLARPLPMRSVREAVPLVRLVGMALAGLVLLLACMNVANLLLVRATARQREMAVRAALGASRGRLVRQMVTEGLLLSGAGGAAGYAVGQWVSGAYLTRLDLGADLPLGFDTSLDLGVFLFSLGTAVVSGLLIGLWPAWRASRADARAALHDGGWTSSEGGHRQRLRRLLVVGQISGALTLLIVAGLFIRTLSSAHAIDLGFDAQTLISVRLDPKQLGYDDDRTVEFYRELQRRVAAWTDVEAVAVCLAPPMSYLIGGGSIYVEGRPSASNSQPPASFINHVGHDYFKVMGIPIVRGRAFTEDDEGEVATTRRFAIVNESFASTHWPGENPIGKRFHAFNLTEPLLEVVGVARDSKYVVVFESQRPYVYLPITRDLSLRTLVVRAANPATLGPRLEREIKALSPEMPMADLRTMDETLQGAFGFLIFRIGAIQAGGLGLIGLGLAIIGVYGVVSFGASLRTREIGIRVALGAQTRDVLRLIVGQGFALVAMGLLIGLIASVQLSRVLSHFVPLVDATDWVTFAAVAVALALLALLACYVPARRATKVSVMAALRYE
jgi:predicted permease